MDGVIVVDKSAGCTSHDVVAKMRRISNERKIGHLGTLDPMATGVLPLIAGRATRLARFFTSNTKRYEAGVQFGIATDSYDRDGVVTSSTPAAHVDPAELEAALDSFRGEFFQTPPPVSAKKVGGVRAYKLARQNVPIQLAPVPVTVFSLQVLECEGTRARLSIHCSAGTYVRSIAHELGQKLGCGAMLDSLRRLASGDFSIDQARTLEQLKALAATNDLETALIPPERLLPDFPSERVDGAISAQIRQGKDFRVSPFRQRPDARYVKAVADDGQLIAIGEAKLPNLYHPVLVL